MCAQPVPAVRRDKRARRGHGGITLVDVARLAGVSPITVSRALNNPQIVSPEALKKVLHAVQQTGYVPNLLAGGLASSHSRLVAAIVPSIGSGAGVFMEMLQSLTESLADLGYQVMLGQSGYELWREDALLDAIIGRRPDGIVITGVIHSAQGRRRLLGCGIPIVETWDLTQAPLDMVVGFSHEGVGEAVVEYLHAKGRRHFAVLTGDDDRAARRCTAFAARAQALCGSACAGASKPVEIPTFRVPAPSTVRSGRSTLPLILSGYPEVDAIFCSSDLLALGVMIEAQARGIPIPERLAVVGFGDLPLAADFHPALTSVHIDGIAIGRTAAQFIEDRVKGRDISKRVVDIGYKLIERDSG